MNINFKNKSADFFYKMMMMRFEQSIDDIKKEDVKKLNILLKNEMAGVIFIHSLAEYIKKHFNDYVKRYGDGSEKLSDVNINIVIDAFFQHTNMR